MLTSSNILLFDNVEITQITGGFSYIQYDKNEYIEPSINDIKRYAHLTWESSREITNVEPPDNIDIVSEQDLQSGFFSMTTSEENQWDDTQTQYSNNIRPGSFYDRYLRGISPDDTVDFDLSGDPLTNSAAVVYDPSSGQPIVSKSKKITQNSRSFLSEAFASYYGKNILLQPTTDYKSISSIQWKLDTIQIDSISNRKKRLKLDEQNGIEDIFWLSKKWTNQGSQNNGYQGESGKLGGFIIQRFDESGTLDFSVFQRSNYFYDFSVLYGQSYTYVVYPVIILSSLLVMINNEAKVTIECKEVIPPEPPRDFRISWKGEDKYLITWKPTFREVVISDPNVEIPAGTVTGDVKGYQIFRRSKLTDPYQLLAQISFNDVVNDQLREEIKSKVPKSLLVDKETNNQDIAPMHPSFFEIELLSNRDHYVTMCALDARGQPSGYSSQYRIFRNSVTGEITQELVSLSGAPRNQPNLLLKSPVVQDSFKVSGLNHCRVYFNPDLSNNVPDSGESIDLQMFDTKTDIYQSHKISIKITN